MTESHSPLLTQSARIAVVAKHLGYLWVLLAALTVVPLAVSSAFGEWAMAARLAAVTVLMLVLGLLLARLRAEAEVHANEALAITSLAFLTAPLFMMYPLMGPGVTPLDAWFEAVSGITTTGLTTLTSVTQQSPAFLFTRAWMQWYGGLGIAVLSVALFMPHHITARRLVQPTEGEQLTTTARTHARRVLTVYGVLTIVAIAAAIATHDRPFVGVVHALAAISTGGFSAYDQSLARMSNPLAPAVLIATAFLGAICFPVYFNAVRKGPRVLITDPEVRALFVVGLLVSLLLLPFIHETYGTWGTASYHALLDGFAAQTTAGFSTQPLATLPPPAKLVLIGAMLMGGSSGSSAGGIKLIRVLVVVRLARTLLQRSAAPPHAVIEPRIGRQRLELDESVHTLLLILLFFGLVGISWFAFLAAGYAPLDALFDVVSAVGTVGLSTGVAGHGLAPLLKLVLIADMTLGRIEILAMLILLYPRTWTRAKGIAS